MLKFLYYTDPHNKVTNPTARLDKFKETIMKKQRYVGELARLHSVNAVLIGGDILDKPDNPDEFVRELQKIHAEYGIPVYSAIGNHDEWGYNPETFPRTSFGLLEGPGIINRLYMDKPTNFDDGKGTKVAITGCDAHFNLDKEGRITDYVDVPEQDGFVNIHVLHSFLTDDPDKWEKIPHTYIPKVFNTKADVLLTGHEHSGFEIIKVDKTLVESYNKSTDGRVKMQRVSSASIFKRNGEKLFCNPGALARVSCSVGDVNLEVKVALISVVNDNITIELIKLPTEIARPSNEVLDRDKLMAEKESREQLQNFITKIGNVDTTASFNTYQVLDDIAKEDGISESVVEGVRVRIEKAEQELAGENKSL